MSEGATELYDAIRHAMAQGCDVVFHPEIDWEAIGVEVRLRASDGIVIKTANGRVSENELVCVSEPAGLIAWHLRNVTDMVCKDETPRR